MQRYVIERDILSVGSMSRVELREASRKSNAALAELATKIQWQHSYVAGNKTFCIYLAENEDAIRKHSELSGFPANIITPIVTMIDPTTGN